MSKHFTQFFQQRLFKWRRWLVIALCSLFVIGATAIAAQAYEGTKAPRQVKFTLSASPAATIARGVAFPKNVGFYFTSGTVPPAVNLDAPATSRERFGDTYTQAKGTLEQIESLLKEEGLSLKDVAFLICYLVPDPALNGQVDYQGWFRAYGEFFSNEANPVKTARSTVGVQSLVNAGWLVEIEAIAVYPR
ncbi:MAG: RidA family protein [Tildeniella nuda ZEHNDER 1965/U140]|jgi:enamine deaminase RidA (YjgF/YER057c/UK114 family)|nr:RidA family protein [Tildeniella nuda ZEHNDER 1965/U140]